MKHSTGKPTKTEQDRFYNMKLGVQCVACYQLGIRKSGYIEIHHLLSGNKRIGHMATISLCPYHHRGVVYGDELSMSDAKKLFGPSLAHGSKPFHAEFGSDAELLAMQNEFLE